ncbi:RNA-binding protein 44 isoform X1 [Micropterus salmoides]|uniref:RNA-binding protein 44 isoform X1 n=1 Tax=Micropterus salmoides TaxID=27706 RepID=UPI0018ECA85F|nr:RNA-binding protein 44 isoform X1 [Micropterus salmoides]
MTTQQSVWPSFPVTLPYQVTVPWPSCLACDYAGVVVQQSPGLPCFYNTVIEKPCPQKIRRFFLERSVFELVEHHQYLPLSDQKLLGWYFGLSPEDKNTILEEGGFHRFLQRHPALEVSTHHVFVKYDIERTHPTQQTITSNNQMSGTSGAKYRCAVPHTRLKVEAPPTNVRSTFMMGCSNSWDGSQKHPHEEQLVSPLKSEWPTFVNESPSEYYTLDNIEMDGTECSDSRIQTVEQEQVSSLPDPDEENKTKEGCQDYMVHGNEYPLDDAKACLSFEVSSDKFHSIKEDDDSILACVASKDMKAHIEWVPVTTNVEALTASRETLKSNHSVLKINTAEKCTSPMPGMTTCDIIVGTELPPCKSAFTQTKDPATSDKHLMTEVHMADLDYLAEEFIKLRVAKEELAEQKAKSSGFKKECDCVHRARQAELCLLALQYSMCRQHCWRLYYISVEGGQLTELPQTPPANFVNVLQKLESDYNQMKDKILAGVPLQQLKPLSVDSEKITIGASFIPAQIIGDVLGNVSSWNSQEPQKRTSDEANGCPDNESRNGCQHSERKGKQENSNVSRAVTLPPQDRDATHEHKQEVKQTSACEAWYDAEEDLELAGPAVAAETGQDPTMVLKDQNNEPASMEAKRSALCVSNLTSNVTERIIQPPFSSSIKNRKVVCISPTAKGTCVPQHFGTMSSFDTLMAELTQRHPDIGRQRIVDALIELKAKHQGILSGLPLRTIRDMISELLTRPASATQL